MLTKEQVDNPFCMMDRIEFKKMAIRHDGGEIITLE